MIGDNDMRERLGAIDTPPTGLTVAGLVADGRRKELRRRVTWASCGVAVATGLLVAVPSVLLRPEPAAPQQVAAAPSAAPGSNAPGPREPVPDPALPTVSCTATTLPVPAGLAAVSPVGVDPSGRYIIGQDYHESTVSTAEGKVVGVGDATAVLWTDGVPTTLPKPHGWVSPAAVNAAGTVVALSGPKDGWADTVLRYTGGVPAELTAPAGKWIFRSAKLNARGDIIVNASRADSSDYRIDAVLLWKAGEKTGVKLPLPADVTARAITDDGHIVGGRAAGPDTADLSSYVWNQQGKGRKLGAPAGQTAAVFAVRGDYATGNLWPSGAVGRWKLSTGAGAEVPVDAPASGINADGWIAAAGTVLRPDANVEIGLAGTVKGSPSDIADNGLVVGAPFDGSPGVITWRCDG